MIRISGISGEIAKFDLSDVTLWEIATMVRRKFGIPRCEQQYYRECEQVAKVMQIQGGMELTMVRCPVTCSGCGKAQRKRKYKVCGGCMDACYCSEVCQKGHWNCHKKKCVGKMHEHKYKKVYPNGPRDNNEYDLVCECGRIA